MTLTLLPDAARVMSEMLRAQPEVTALVDDRVFTVLPSAAEFPAVRLTPIGGRVADDGVWWLHSTLVQVDAWSTTRLAVHEIAETLRAVIHERLPGVHTLTDSTSVVVTGVTLGGIREGAAPDMAPPAHHHASFDAVVASHPRP